MANSTNVTSKNINIHQNQNELYSGQVCLHIQGICYSYRSSTVQKNESNRTQITREQYTNIRIGNLQNGKNPIYNTDIYVWGLICANLKWKKNKCVWCQVFMRWIAWGRNCFCVWSFWCSELCSIDQTVIFKRGSVLNVKGPEQYFQPFCSLWISTVLGEWGGYQWFAQQFGLPSVVFWGQIW